MNKLLLFWVLAASLLMGCTKDESNIAFPSVEVTGTRWGYIYEYGDNLRYHNIEFVDERKALFYTTSVNFKVQIGKKNELSYIIENRDGEIPRIILSGVSNADHIPREFVRTDDPNTILMMCRRKESGEVLKFLIGSNEFTQIHQWMLDVYE